MVRLTTSNKTSTFRTEMFVDGLDLSLLIQFDLPLVIITGLGLYLKYKISLANNRFQLRLNW